MANDVGNVVVGKPLVTGGVLTAPVGTTLPTNASGALNGAFEAVGYITSDGVTKTENRESDTISAWGGDTIAALQSSFGVEFKFKLAEFLGEIAQAAIYGDDNVVATAATSGAGNLLKITVTAAEAPHKSWVFEIINGIKKVRIVVPNAQITATGDVVFKDDDVAANDVTLTCFPDGSGAYFYVYTDDGRLTSES